MKLTPEAKNFFEELKNGGNNLIAGSDLMQKIDNKEDVLVLDIRSEADYNENHVPTAVHCPWSKVGEMIESDKLSKDQHIVVACYTGQTAGQTVGVLKSLGYKACSLKGGMNNGWKKDGLPLEAKCTCCS